MPFSPVINLGGIGMVQNVGQVELEFLGQTRVPPVTYPNLGGMARGWAGQHWARAGRGMVKSFHFHRESIWVESAW